MQSLQQVEGFYLDQAQLDFPPFSTQRLKIHFDPALLDSLHFAEQDDRILREAVVCFSTQQLSENSKEFFSVKLLAEMQLPSLRCCQEKSRDGYTFIQKADYLDEEKRRDTQVVHLTNTNDIAMQFALGFEGPFKMEGEAPALERIQPNETKAYKVAF